MNDGYYYQKPEKWNDWDLTAYALLVVAAVILYFL